MEFDIKLLFQLPVVNVGSHSHTILCAMEWSGNETRVELGPAYVP